MQPPLPSLPVSHLLSLPQLVSHLPPLSHSAGIPSPSHSAGIPSPSRSLSWFPPIPSLFLSSLHPLFILPHLMSRSVFLALSVIPLLLCHSTALSLSLSPSLSLSL